MNVCACYRMEEAADILVKRGQCIVFARLMGHSFTTLSSFYRVVTRYMVIRCRKGGGG